MRRPAGLSTALHLEVRNDRTSSLNTISFLLLSHFFRGAPAFSLDNVNLYIVPDFQWVDVGFFDFTMVGKQYSLETVFECDSFPGLAIHDSVLSGDAGQWQPQHPVSHESQQPIHSQPFFTHTTILVSTFSIVFSKLHEAVNTLL